MLKNKAIASLAAASILFGGVTATTHAAPKTDDAKVKVTTPTKAYYNYDGYVSADILKDKYLKPALDVNNFTYDGVKLGDSLTQVQKVLKSKKYELKATDNKNVYTVHNAVLSFQNGKLVAMNFVFNSGKATATNVQKTFGKPVSKTTTKSGKVTTTTYNYNVKNGKAGVIVNFEKKYKTHYSISLTLNQ